MAKTYGEGGLFYDKTTAGGTPTAIKSFYGGSAVPEPLKFSTLVYPKDLNPDNFYPDCICFTIQKRTGVSIDDFTSAGSKGIEKFNKGVASALAKLPEEIRKKFKKVVKDLGKNPTEKAIREGKQAVLDEHNKIQAEKNEALRQADLDSGHGNSVNPDSGFLIAPEDLLENLSNAFEKFGAEISSRRGKALQRGKEGKNIIGSIYMNMPNGITFNEKANWSGTEMGFMGHMTQDFVGLGTGDIADITKTLTGAAAGSAGSIVGAAIGAIPSLVSKLGLSGGMFGAAIGAMAAGGPLQQGAESALGVAQNPYMEMMFSGIGFRAFQFEFIMRPRNTAEVYEVSEILRMFRTFTKPSFVEGALGKSFMDYPMEFQVEFLTTGGYGSANDDMSDDTKAVRNPYGDYVTNPNVPKLKDCVCDNVSANYTPQSIWAAHHTGVPIAVNLSLSFQETELVMAEDVYREGY